jgi:TonB-linked SusC/RagA family outer membrane protein
MSWNRGFRALLAAVAMMVVAAPAAVAQQVGTVRGTVVEAATLQPIAAAQVVIEGTQLGTLTDNQGRFNILNVPAGAQTVRVVRIGFGTLTQAVEVVSGQAVTVQLRVATEAIALQEIVVTGVGGATARAKVPFAVEQIRAEDLPVAMVSAGQAIQGKVAGAQVVSGSGRPGSGHSVLLRGATSIDATGRNQEPLFVVDGVIVGAGTVDIDGLDIENIEIVRGAAGASLYGSRAANGVIQITTRRGQRAQADQVRYTLRSETGRSALAKSPEMLLTDAHFFRLVDTVAVLPRFDAAGNRVINPNGTLASDTVPGRYFLTPGGVPCRWLECSSVQLAGQGAGPGQVANAWNTYATQSWPGQTFDQVQAITQRGGFAQQSVSVEGRSGATNFFASFSRTEDQGILPGFDGYRRNNFRVNVDQSVRPTLQLSASAFYSRGRNDQFPETNGNPFFRLTRLPAGVDLTACDPRLGLDPTRSCAHAPDSMVLVANPSLTAAESVNPLYEFLTRQYTVDRSRFLGSSNLRFSPAPFFDFDLAASYDRLDYDEEDYRPLGYRTPTPAPATNRGTLFRWLTQTEAMNLAGTGTFRFNLADGIRNRTQLRYLYEQSDFSWNLASGHSFGVEGIKEWGNIDQTTIGASSILQPVRSDGYFLLTNFDIHDRYIIDALARNDGSSLFGPDQRRHWYYRLAGAWRLGEEPWFNAPFVDELKLRYALGTAGNRPQFAAQYETFSLAGGLITPLTLGNRELRPEHSTEQEMGIDLAFLNRFVVALTYANSVTDDQILRRPLPGYTGYREQWVNAGTLEGNTFEASLDARLLERGAFRWNGRVVFDRTTSTITGLNVPAFRYGLSNAEGQNIQTIFYAREGERLGTFYGAQAATSCEHLPAGMSCDGFEVNRDGYLVWVGAHGLDNRDAWGEFVPATVSGAAPHLASMMYGTPFRGQCADRVSGEQTLYCPLGSTVPDFSLALSSNMNWRGFTLYGLVDAVQGISVYNQPLQWATFRRTSGFYDERDLPEDQQRPLGYFDALYGGMGGLQPSSVFVEDASFVKLREVSVGYRLGGDQLSGIPLLGQFSGMGINVQGRNLLTWTDYRGFDPEVGMGAGSTGSAALGRVEGYQYPNFRTWTLGIELNF